MRFLLPLLIVLPTFCLAAETSTLAMLDGPEKTYYEKVFSYTMDVTKPGASYDWAGYTGKGTITVDKIFVSKSGATCRNFSETFSVQGNSGSGKGVGCKREGDNGWCKLRTDNALTCAMEQPASMFGNMSGILDAPSIPSPNVTVPPINANAPSVSSPNVNAPSMPNAEVKKTDKPGSSYADGVTSNAGKAAGSAFSNGVSWFSKTFR